MSEHNPAHEARHGLIDSVKAKAKEIFGAVSGNDSLTAEGQLEQAEARQRRAANTAEALADAESQRAYDDAAEARLEGAEARGHLSAEAASIEQGIHTDALAQKRAAELGARQEVLTEAVRAEQDARRQEQQAVADQQEQSREAVDEVVDAAAEQRESVQDAARAKAKAQRIRSEADQLTNEADLP